MTYPVLDVSSWDGRGVEPQGATEHPWLRDPAGDPHLWKPARGRRLERREHWAEKVVSELAWVFGVPAARVQLAERAGDAGCVSENVVPQGNDYHSGARLLAGVDSSFRPTERGHPAYTVDNVLRVLDGGRPPQWSMPTVLPSSMNAFDLFAGYLVLDAVVLNRDRHAENWGIFRSRGDSQPDRLCPLFDNASALLLSMSDHKMKNRCDSRGLPVYVANACVARPFAPLADGVPLTLFQVAAQALSRCGEASREHWLGRVDALSGPDLDAILAAVPGMSEVARRFVVLLVETTRRRIVDECSS